MCLGLLDISWIFYGVKPNSRRIKSDLACLKTALLLVVGSIPSLTKELPLALTNDHTPCPTNIAVTTGLLSTVDTAGTWRAMTDRRDEITAEVNAKIDSLKWIKLVGVGNVATGKTCLIKYFCENRFAPGYQPTVGVDYGFKIETVTNEEVRVHLWDLSGSDDYYETRIELYHKTDGVFLVYDVTNANSFDAINQWLEEVNKSCSPKPIMVLCACKVDQKQKRVVTKEKGEEWARQNKMGYFEVSAATGDNVIKMYDSLIASILSKR